jgi:hypothetical protein
MLIHSIELNAKEWADLNDFFTDLREVISSDCNACHVRVTCARDDLLLTRLTLLAAELAKAQVTITAKDGRQVPISLQVISEKPDAQALVIA